MGMGMGMWTEHEDTGLKLHNSTFTRISYKNIPIISDSYTPKGFFSPTSFTSCTHSPLGEKMESFFNTF